VADQVKSVPILFNVLLNLLAANHMAAGRADEARAEITAILQANPNLTLTQVRAMAPFSKEENLNRYLDQLRQAGLPE